MEKPMLQISGLNKNYRTRTGNVTALNNVSLYIRKGEFVAIIGRSGAGKSTLLNMIAGLDKPDSGSILFEGTELVGLSDSRAAILRRRSIGVIYQFYNLMAAVYLIFESYAPVHICCRFGDSGNDTADNTYSL